ncbi:MAG: hypothetical protein AAFP89_10655 [Bacteroidota bacterium]
MEDILEALDHEIDDRIFDYQSLGGVIEIAVFENVYGDESYSEYDIHQIVARKTVDRLPDGYTDEFDEEMVELVGERLSYDQFLGAHYDIETQRPIIKSKGKNTLNAYFFYDSEEHLSKKVDINLRTIYFNEKYPEDLGGFISCFMEPPYGLRLGKTIKERGEYLLSFMDFFFGDVQRIEVYAWNTDCSSFFDVGKEWWGSYFWTVYNPTKEWYISLAASATD